MKFEAKFIAIAGALMIAGSSFAAFKAPPTCPNVSAIKVEGLSNAEPLMEHLYIDYQISEYNTDLNWFFAAGPFEGETAEDALEEGNKSLRYLSGSPIAEPNEDAWVCVYEMDENHFAVAIQSDEMPSTYKLKRYLKKR